MLNLMMLVKAILKFKMKYLDNKYIIKFSFLSYERQFLFSATEINLLSGSSSGTCWTAFGPERPIWPSVSATGAFFDNWIRATVVVLEATWNSTGTFLTANWPVGPFTVHTRTTITRGYFSFGQFGRAWVISNTSHLSSTTCDTAASPWSPFLPVFFCTTGGSITTEHFTANMFRCSDHYTTGTGWTAFAPRCPFVIWNIRKFDSACSGLDVVRDIRTDIGSWSFLLTLTTCLTARWPFSPVVPFWTTCVIANFGFFFLHARTLMESGSECLAATTWCTATWLLTTVGYAGSVAVNDFPKETMNVWSK